MPNDSSPLMNTNQLASIIQEAISSKKVLSLTIKHGLGEKIDIEIEPYIYGDDTMQYSFVWGYLSFSRLFYKLRFDSIEKATILKKEFGILPNAVYYYTLEEELWEIISGFDQLYLDSHIGREI